MSQSSISKIHTSCKDCTFAVYSENTQIGCELDLIDKYESKETTIIEAYDENKEFYVIDNKKCIGYRNLSWSEKDGIKLNLEDKKIKIKNEFKIKYILFIDLKHFDNNKFENLIENINQLKTKPSKIILLRYGYSDSAIFEYEYIRDRLKDSGLDCEWRIQTMVDEEVSIRSILSSTISTNTKYKFMFYISDYIDILRLNKIIELANTTIYDDLNSFIVISDKDYTAKLFLGLIYRYAWLSSGINILETIDDFTVVS